MTTEKKNELQKKTSSEISAELSVSKADLEQMYGGMGQEDVTVPRVVILQGLSPEVTEGKGTPGQFYIKGFERNLSKGPVEFIVIMRNKSRIRWRDLKLGGGILCTSTDAKIGQGDPGGECEKCAHNTWTSTDGKPTCDLYQNVILVLRQDEDWVPMALSGNRTKLKAIKNLNSLLMLEMSKGRPLCAKSYLLESMQRQNPQGLQYFTYRISPGNNNVSLPIEEQRRALALYNSLRGKKLNIIEDTDDINPTPQSTDNF